MSSRKPQLSVVVVSMNAPTKGCYAKLEELQPSWVKTITLTGNAGQYAVQATFPRCSCRKAQERVGVTFNRNTDQATSDLLGKVSP